MKISKLYLYPVKSLRGIELDSATLTKLGFPYDRSFMLLGVQRGKDKQDRDHEQEGGDGGVEYNNMAVSHRAEMVRFFPSISYPSDGDGASEGAVSINYKPPTEGDEAYSGGNQEKTITFPLQPQTDDLEIIEITMHKSPTKAYKMPQRYNDELSGCFGYEVVLAYLGENRREVLMSSKPQEGNSSSTAPSSNGWFSSITGAASTVSSYITGNGSAHADDEEDHEAAHIRFSDVAPYLIVSEKSMDDVHHRLGEGQRMDITKFRPNIIVTGAEEPWEEDYWGEVTINGRTRIECVHNCSRCTSINVDYETGQFGKAAGGTILKKLQRDRRVDRGAKWSPIFGRYGFLPPDSDAHTIRMGDEVVVSKRNTEQTSFGKCQSFVHGSTRSNVLIFFSLFPRILDWKGLNTL